MASVKGKIAFQGQRGAYSDMACRAVYLGRKTLPCATFEDAFAAVRSKKAGLAMIPVDNALAGRVADVHHLLPGSNLYIIGEHFHPIRHALLGLPEATKKDIKHVHSHIHAIPQCRKIIRRMRLQAHVGTDTAGAAAAVAKMKDRSHAAIASELAAKIYGLKILQHNVQDADHNTTRFLILSREHIVPPQRKNAPCITSIIFRTRNIPAALYKALGGFATNGISMAKLESYVDPAFDVAQFYAEVEGHPDSRALTLALEELRFFAEKMQVLGTYPAHPFRRHKKTK